MLRRAIMLPCFTLLVSFILYSHANAQDGQSLVKAAVDYYRGETSIATVDMVIHRPNWERTLSIKAAP